MACGTLNGENERVQGDQVADGGIEEVLRLFLLEGGPGSSGQNLTSAWNRTYYR